MDTSGGQHFVPYSSEVSLIHGLLWYTSGRCGTHNRAVDYSVAALLELSIAERWQGRLSRGYYYEYNNLI